MKYYHADSAMDSFCNGRKLRVESGRQLILKWLIELGSLPCVNLMEPQTDFEEDFQVEKEGQLL